MALPCPISRILLYGIYNNMAIQTIDNLPPRHVVFKANNQCAETDNIAMYRRYGDGFIRNEFYKVEKPLQFLPDLHDPFNHMQLYRQGIRCPYRKNPLEIQTVHDPVMLHHNPVNYYPLIHGYLFTTLYSVTTFNEPFNQADIMVQWATSNHNANVNYTEFPTPRWVSHFVVFSRETPTQTLRVFTVNPATGARTPLAYQIATRFNLMGCNGGLFVYNVLQPIKVPNLLLEYTNITYFQAYQATPVTFNDLIYFEDYPDKRLPNDVSLRTKRTVNAECARELNVFGSPASGLLMPLTPLFDETYSSAGYAIIEKYVKNGMLQSFARTQSMPNRLRFTYTLPAVFNVAALEFIVATPSDLPDTVTLPDLKECIYPQVVLIEGRLEETDAWHVLDEVSLNLITNPSSQPPSYFTNFLYLTYRRPVKEIRFTVQSVENYQPFVNNRYNIAKTHFYFPKIRCFGNV